MCEGRTEVTSFDEGFGSHGNHLSTDGITGEFRWVSIVERFLITKKIN